MTSEIQSYNFKGAALRTLTDGEGEPWFVAKDVCDILEISNPSDALKRLDDDERSRFNLGRQGGTNRHVPEGADDRLFRATPVPVHGRIRGRGGCVSVMTDNNWRTDTPWPDPWEEKEDK